MLPYLKLYQLFLANQWENDVEGFGILTNINNNLKPGNKPYKRFVNNATI